MISKKDLFTGWSAWPYTAFKRNVLSSLAKSVFASPGTWPSAVAAFEHVDFDNLKCDCRIVSRDELASEFRAADLHDLAKATLQRRVGPGRILVWYVKDDDELGAEANFGVIDLIGRPVSRC